MDADDVTTAFNHRKWVLIQRARLIDEKWVPPNTRSVTFSINEPHLNILLLFSNGLGCGSLKGADDSNLGYTEQSVFDRYPSHEQYS